MARRGLRATCILLTGLATAAGPAAAGPAAAGPAEAGPTTGQAASTSLISVATTGPDNAWAAGYFQTGATNKTLIIHWTGKSWRQVPTPNPAPGNDTLAGITAISPSNAWAVGNTGAGRLMILHWNGRSWTVTPSPPVAGGGNLASVSALSARDVWAVGFGGKKVSHAVIEHWNGRIWNALRSPSVAGGAELFSVTARTPSDVWAVGQRDNPGGQLIEHWNGHSWKLVPSPGPKVDLLGVAATSALDAWAVSGVGGRAIGTGISLISHWNGARWRRVASPNPNPGGAFLQAVAAVSPSRAWAVGTDIDFVTSFHNVIMAWNGRAWKLEKSPVTDGLLLSVAATSASNAWAVGGGDSGGLILHWNGARWTARSFSAP